MASISTPPINFSTKHIRFSSLYLSPNRVSPNNVVLKSRSLVSRVSCLASLPENHKSPATVELSTKVLKFSGLSLPLRRRGSIGLLVPAAAGVKTSIFNGVFQICRGQLLPLLGSVPGYELTLCPVFTCLLVVLILMDPIGV